MLRMGNTWEIFIKNRGEEWNERTKQYDKIGPNLYEMQKQLGRWPSAQEIQKATEDFHKSREVQTPVPPKNLPKTQTPKSAKFKEVRIAKIAKPEPIKSSHAISKIKEFKEY